MPTKQEIEASNKELERGLQEALAFNKSVLNSINDDNSKRIIGLIKMSTALFFFYMLLLIAMCFYLRFNNL
jgi:hypothetical protein